MRRVAWLLLWVGLFAASPPGGAQGIERADPAAMEAITRATPAPTDPGRLVNEPLKQIGEYAIRGGKVHWGFLLAAAGLVVVIASAVSFRRWWERRDQAPPPLSAFLLVARRLDLTWPDRLLLWRIARANKLPTPLALLLASGTLYHHGRQFAAGLPVERRKKLLRRVSAIQRAAFGDRAAPDLPAPPAAAP